jgi:Protein of unknown function (DUF416)
MMRALALDRAANETAIAGRLAVTPSAARTLFAYACAECLIAAFRWFCDVTGSTTFKVVRRALDTAWSLWRARLGFGSADIAALLPDDEDGEMSVGSAVAQNAVARVAYALEVRQMGAVQPAVWAARLCIRLRMRVGCQKQATLFLAAGSVTISGRRSILMTRNDEQLFLDYLHRGVYLTQLILNGPHVRPEEPAIVGEAEPGGAHGQPHCADGKALALFLNLELYCRSYGTGLF